MSVYGHGNGNGTAGANEHRNGNGDVDGHGNQSAGESALLLTSVVRKTMSSNCWMKQWAWFVSLLAND